MAVDLSPESIFDSGKTTAAERAEIERLYGIIFPLWDAENEDHHAQPVEVPSATWGGGAMPDLVRWDFSWRNAA